MTGQNGLAAAILGTLLAATGCVTCQHKGFAESMTACATSPVPCPVRQEVYVFAMNGVDVCDLCGLCGLRDRLCILGFPKVYTGSLADCWWFQKEIRRIHQCDPAARFVFVGVGAAARTVVSTAATMTQEGVPVDAVVFLDPVGLSANLSQGVPYRTIAITSCYAPSTGLIAQENVLNPNACHFGLPGHEQTAQVIHDILVDSAARVGPLEGLAVPMLPLSDTPLPTPRPVDLKTPATRDEWDFLKLPNGGVSQPGTVLTATPEASPAKSTFVPTSRSR